MELVVHPDPEALAAGAAERIAAVIAGALASSDDPVAVGLAGGTTPEAAYLRLRGIPLDWSRVDLWLTDERWVPPDHPESNGGMVAAALGDHVPVALHRPRFSESLEPEESAAFYEATLRHLVPGGEPELVLLGLGADGHTASLFPGTPALHASDRRWFVANDVPRHGPRLTVTPSLLARSRRIIVLVAGGPKAAALAGVLDGDDDVPARLLTELGDRVTWLVDAEAAAGLSPAVR